MAIIFGDSQNPQHSTPAVLKPSAMSRYSSVWAKPSMVTISLPRTLKAGTMHEGDEPAVEEDEASAAAAAAAVGAQAEEAEGFAQQVG